MAELLRRLHRELECRPLALARNLPAAFYCDAELAGVEQRALFDSSWQMVGHESQLPRSGSYLATELVGQPIVVTRDDQGLHAFHNVCRHRAGPVASGQGCADALVCRYHGWRYGLDGQLQEAPDFGDARGFATHRVRLEPVALASWCGLLFACAGQPPLPLDALLAGIRERLGPEHPLEGYRHASSHSYQLACNWKTYVDNFLEGYHVPAIHPGLNAQLAFDQYQTETCAHYSAQWSPLNSAITRGGATLGTAWYFHIHPNLMLNFLPGRLQVNRVIPMGADRCRVDFDYYYADDVDAAQREADQESAHQTQLEDIEICQIVQRNMQSGGYVAGRLSPRWEQALWCFQNWIRQRLQTTLTD